MSLTCAYLSKNTSQPLLGFAALRLAQNGYIANMTIAKITFHYISLVAMLLLASCSSLSDSGPAI
jgi:hypothetical protein